MQKNTSSVDGFIPKRRPTLFSDGDSGREQMNTESVRPQLGETDNQALRESDGFLASDIDESLKNIEDEKPAKKRRRIFRRKDKQEDKPRTRFQIIRKRLIIALVVILLLAGAFLAIKAFINGSIIFQGNLLGLFQNKPLQMDANGRSNVLIFGTSEDDKGHEAAYLTDSIMVVSIDQNKKDAYMISIPRDLYVTYGKGCVAGYEGKINALFGCYSNDGKNEKAGAKALKGKVGEILGLDVQYYAHVNYSVVRDTVKALDGVTVNIESRDPRGILDSNFDWKCNAGDPYASYATKVKNCPPDGHFIDYPNGPVKLDAEHALYLAQARGNTAPTYGLEQSNFDREKNQQKILKAIREKAVSAGTLTNVGKVTGLIDAMGKNLRTDFDTSEVRTLIQLGQDIPSDKIKSISLVEEGSELVTNVALGGASSVAPIAGTYDYSEIHSYVAKKLSRNPVIREGANVAVFNASGQVGAAQTEADKLSDAGYTIYAVDNAPAGDYGATSIYRQGKDNSGTARSLAKRYNVEIKKTLPFAVDSQVDFVIVIGAPPAPTASNN